MLLHLSFLYLHFLKASYVHHLQQMVAIQLGIISPELEDKFNYYSTTNLNFRQIKIKKYNSEREHVRKIYDSYYKKSIKGKNITENFLVNYRLIKNLYEYMIQIEEYIDSALNLNLDNYLLKLYNVASFLILEKANSIKKMK